MTLYFGVPQGRGSDVVERKGSPGHVFFVGRNKCRGNIESKIRACLMRLRGACQLHVVRRSVDALAVEVVGSVVVSVGDASTGVADGVGDGGTRSSLEQARPATRAQPARSVEGVVRRVGAATHARHAPRGPRRVARSRHAPARGALGATGLAVAQPGFAPLQRSTDINK